MINTIFNEKSISFSLEKSLYNLEVLHKCFYWYGNNFDVEISEFNDLYYQVSFQVKSDNFEFVQQTILSKIKQDLIDFKLRDIITKETKNIRELLVAKAFAHYEEDNPQTSISDPVGFNPESIF